MIQQVTNGIKISIETKFVGTHHHDNKLLYAFSYQISIENNSNDSVQLLNRHWKIFDSLNNTEIIEGPGVIGEKPILKPSQKHTYQSNCMLKSPIGSMRGFYEMINFTSTKKFKVQIPTFQLMVTRALN
jgi:ApaG protein